MGKVHWAAELLTLSTKIKELTNKTPWAHLFQGLQNRLGENIWELAPFTKQGPLGNTFTQFLNPFILVYFD